MTRRPPSIAKKGSRARPASDGLAEERLVRIGLGTAAAIYLALALLYFLPALLPGRGIFGTDYLAGGYFTYDFISQLISSGALPKWTPYLYGGLPIFSNPASTFHPVHLVADLLVATSRVLAIVFIFHFWAAGIGLYLLGRELGCRDWVAFLGGLAFQFTGLTLSWVYAGHDGRVMVTTMAPLLFFFLHRGIRTGSPASFAGAATALGFALLSFQIQNAYYLLLSGGIWGVFVLIWSGIYRERRRMAGVVAMGVASVAFAFLLAAVNFLPFLGYVPESPRGGEEGRGYEYSVSFSMPPGDLLSLAVPEQTGASVYEPETGRALFPEYRGPNPMKLHTEYVGAFVVLLVLVGGYYSRRNGHWWFFLGLSVFFLTLSFGGFTPLYRLYFELLPGIRRFRAPDLAFYVCVVSFVMMATLTLERLAQVREARSAPRSRAPAPEERTDIAAWIFAGLLGMVVVGALVAGASAESEPGLGRAGGWWRFFAFAAATGGVLWAWLSDRLATLTTVVLLAAVTTADLWAVGRRFFHTVPPPEQMFAADDVAGYLLRQQGPFRVWNLPFAPHRGRVDNYLMSFGIEQAGGEHGNQLQRWNEYVGAGTEVLVDWHNFLEHPVFMSAANVRYLVSTAELAVPWLREVHRGSALIYENLDALPRAWLVGEATVLPEGAAIAAMREEGWDPRARAFVYTDSDLGLPGVPAEGAAEIVSRSADRITVRTRSASTALLVIADNMYAGWEASVGGESAAVHRTNHTFRGVVVPAGEHLVEFRFRPTTLYTGLYLYIGGFALLLFYASLLLWRRLRVRPAPAT